MAKARKQRWVMVLEDQPREDEDFYTKAEILRGIILDDVAGLSIKSLKKETK